MSVSPRDGYTFDKKEGKEHKFRPFKYVVYRKAPRGNNRFYGTKEVYCINLVAFHKFLRDQNKLNDEWRFLPR